MINDTSARAGRHAAPLYDYDITNEYLARLRGADFIPVRKSKDYQPADIKARRRNYLTPLMRSLNNSRKSGKGI